MRQGLTLIELLVTLLVIALCGAMVVPGMLTSNRASNERQAMTTLHTITSAESDFRANDRDWNRANDFWVADVSGLWRVEAPKEGAIKLIEMVARLQVHLTGNVIDCSKSVRD